IPRLVDRAHAADAEHFEDVIARTERLSRTERTDGSPVERDLAAVGRAHRRAAVRGAARIDRDDSRDLGVEVSAAPGTASGRNGHRLAAAGAHHVEWLRWSIISGNSSAGVAKAADGTIVPGLSD